MRYLLRYRRLHLFFSFILLSLLSSVLFSPCLLHLILEVFPLHVIFHMILISLNVVVGLLLFFFFLVVDQGLVADDFFDLLLWNRLV